LSFSRRIWYNICFVTDLKLCCHDPIWGVMWIGTDVKKWCHDLFWSAMWVGKDVTTSSTTNLKYYVDQNRWYRMMSWPNLWCSVDLNAWELILPWPNIKCFVDWKWCYRKTSRQIWSTLWNRTNGRGWCHDVILGAFLIGADSDIMLSWLNLKWYLDWNGCDRKFSRTIWSNFRIRKVDGWWCPDLIWGDIWIGTDDIGCCLDQIYIAMCIGKNVTPSFQVHLEGLCGLERMMLDDVLT
jgi:hypothetical protein